MPWSKINFVDKSFTEKTMAFVVYVPIAEGDRSEQAKDTKSGNLEVKTDDTSKPR